MPRPRPPLTGQVLESLWFLPLPAGVQQRVAPPLLLPPLLPVLAGLVGVWVGLGVRLGLDVGVVRVGVRLVGQEGEQRGVGRWRGRPAAGGCRRGDGGLAAVQAVAALPRDLDQARGGAGGRGQRQVGGAERDAAHGAVDAGALVLAARPEVLTVLVHAAVVLAGATLRLCCDLRGRVRGGA